MRTLVIGDIHGAAKALEQVLEKSKAGPDDTIIQLGDVADGWPETADCVNILQQIPNFISLRGNHDVWVYDWFNYGKQPIIWTQQGGKATIDSYIKSGELTDDTHKQFWNEQLDYYIDEKNRLFIHAGWDYLYPFEVGANNSVNAGTIAKECHWDRSLIESARASDKHKMEFKALNEFKEIYIGHTAETCAHPVKYCDNLWNMDAGAGWNGRLAIMDIETKEYWLSDYCKDLYPEHRGRR